MTVATPQDGHAEDPRARRPSDYPVLREVQLRWGDIDMYGHVNNAVYYMLMDTAINSWLVQTTGVDPRELTALGVVVETQCQYFKEIHFQASPRIGIRLAAAGRSSVRYDVAFFLDDDSPCAVARFVHVYIDPVSRRPVDIPQPVRDALGRDARAGAALRP